jgi:hypothetical protein
MRRVLCWVGIHDWEIRRTDDNKPYQTCRRCHKDDSLGEGLEPGPDYKIFPSGGPGELRGPSGLNPGLGAVPRLDEDRTERMLGVRMNQGREPLQASDPVGSGGRWPALTSPNQLCQRP